MWVSLHVVCVSWIKKQSELYANWLMGYDVIISLPNEVGSVASKNKYLYTQKGNSCKPHKF